MTTFSTPYLVSAASVDRRDDRNVDSHYDVVIVGARAAGASTAMLLARRGLRVLAVDRSAYGSDTLSTHSLARTGVLQLSRWGLLDDLRAAGTPVTDTVEFHYGGDPVVIGVGSDVDDVDGLYSPRRTVLDALLVDAAIASGADVRHGVNVVAITSSADGRVNGIEIDVDGVRRRISADWVVGADGMRSKVAKHVGAATVHQESTAGSVLYGYWTGLPDNVMANHWDIRGRASGVIPTNDGHTCVWVAVRSDRFARDARGDILGAYDRAVADSPALSHTVRDADCVGGVRGFAGVPGYLRQAFGPGWALVGDAGYFKDPVSAHGITDAFTSAEFLTDALVAAVDGADPTEALGAYQRQRDELAAMLMPPVADLASLELSPDEAKAAFRAMNGALRAEYALMVDRPTLTLAAA
jgi:flavin-dependent dehydrogenase